MEFTTLARPYAKAAFDHAMALETAKQDGLAKWWGMLSLAASVIEDKAMVQLLDDPKQTAANKVQLLLDIAGDDLSEEGKNFVNILAENGRLTLLPVILEVFKELKAEQEKAVECTIFSAFPIDDEQKTILMKALEKRFQKSVSLQLEVDESLLGGVVIRSGDQVIDGSVRGKLDKLSESITM